MKANQTAQDFRKAVSFLAQIAPGKAAISFEGMKDGGEIKLLVPESDKSHLLPLAMYFLEKKLRITIELLEE